MVCLGLDEQLDNEIYNEGIHLKEKDMSEYEIDGHYYYAQGMKHPVITVNKQGTTYEKNVIKAHELGHHHLTSHNLFESPSWLRKKEELLAERWMLNRVMPIEKLIEAYEAGNYTPFSVADYLEIPVEDLIKGIEKYLTIYGFALHTQKYVITWSPFCIKREADEEKEYF